MNINMNKNQSYSQQNTNNQLGFGNGKTILSKLMAETLVNPQGSASDKLIKAAVSNAKNLFPKGFPVSKGGIEKDVKGILGIGKYIINDINQKYESRMKFLLDWFNKDFGK